MKELGRKKAVNHIKVYYIVVVLWAIFMAWYASKALGY